jgi:hypothetical protein
MWYGSLVELRVANKKQQHGETPGDGSSICLVSKSLKIKFYRIKKIPTMLLYFTKFIGNSFK